MKIFKTVSLTLLLLTISSCTTQKAPITPGQYEDLSYLIYGSITYDEYGIPHVNKQLHERPSDNEEEFIIAGYHDGLPVEYYHIIVSDYDGDIKKSKPFRVIYDWTGKGFKMGYDMSKDIIEDSIETSEKLGGLDIYIIAATGSAIGGASFILSGLGGFIIGTIEAFPATYQEFKKIGIKNRELILSQITLQYDEDMRLTQYALYTPPPQNILASETRFIYNDESTTPSESYNISHFENKKRTIYTGITQK